MATPSYVGRTQLANWMKDYYHPRIQAQYYNSFPMWRRIEKRVDPSDFSGKKAIIPTKIGWSEAVGARAEGGTLPGAYYPQSAQMEVNVALNYGRMRLSRVGMKASRNSAGAWERFLSASMEDIRENMGWDKARQMSHGDATGVLCLAGTGATSATLPFTTTGGESFLRQGMVIDVWTAAGVQEINSIRITAVGATSVTLESPQTWTTGSYIYREDNRNVECMGLAGVMDDGTRVATFQNLARSSNTWLKANMLTNGGAGNRSMTLPLLDQAYLKAETSGGGAYPTAIYSNHLLGAKYADIVRADRRYTPQSVKLDGGWSAVEYTGAGGTCPWILDRMVRKNEIWFVHEPDLLYYILSPLDWVDDDGDVLKWVSGQDDFDAYMAEYAQLGATRCNRSTALTEVSES